MWGGEVAQGLMLSGRRGRSLAAGIETTMLDDRLTSVRYRNFMSFADEEVELGDLAVLVGANGSGKSNFIEGLRFLGDALTIGLDAAVTNRGGIGQVRRKLPNGGRPHDVEIGVEALVDGFRFSYELAISASASGDWRLGNEACRIESGTDEVAGFRLEEEGYVFTPDDEAGLLVKIDAAPTAPALLLPLVSGLYSTLRRFLTGIRAYSLYPDALREPQRLLDSRRLDRDGQNLASVLRKLRERRDPVADRIRDALADLVPGVSNFRVTTNGGYAAVSLALRSGGKDMWFDASQLSDGTLRMLGILTAIHQRPAPSLIAIEEPELTVHPGAVAVLADELVDAAHRTQMLVTTHSPDLVALMPLDSLRVAEMTAEGTKVGRVSEHQVDAVNDKLFSPGDLIRIDGLRRELKPVN